MSNFYNIFTFIKGVIMSTVLNSEQAILASVAIGNPEIANCINLVELMPSNVKQEIQGIAQGIFKAFFSCLKMTGDNQAETAVLSRNLSEAMSALYSLMEKLGPSTRGPSISLSNLDSEFLPINRSSDTASKSFL